MYDAIVVGARCAGSPTAMLLARKGHRVLLLDRASFPSDTLRNHFIQLPGVASLHRWGLLERIAATGCPPIRAVIFDSNHQPVAPFDGVDAHYAPRRFILDTILVEAAAAAGAEVRERFSVHELLWEDGRVVGIRGASEGGSAVEETARIVVGADGHHSLVAKAVGAPKYREIPSLTYAYYSYFSGVPMAGIELWFLDDAGYINFPTNNGLACIAVQAPVAGFKEFRTDIERNFFRQLDRVPPLAERVRAGKRAERWYGTADLENFFRKPYGPGWALVGDAGYHKDPIMAQGVSDAFRDAELLSDAIDAGFDGRDPADDALAAYETKRNELALPGYEANCAMASFGQPPVP
jgi:flavin-dependent dehydrogenase